ncbi:MAG TPA: hypothetical protein VGO94_05705 [Mycobacteriales bacterium]|nr:hypothetical protein [Mycobacteriales bacterium]
MDEATRAALGSDDAVVRAAALAERNRVLERELIAAKGAARQLRAQRAGTSWRLTAPLHTAVRWRGRRAGSGRRAHAARGRGAGWPRGGTSGPRRLLGTRSTRLSGRAP